MGVAESLETKNFEVKRIKETPNFNLIEIPIPEKRVTLWMTDGLSTYNMPVPEKHEDENFVELYFCLPSYWDLQEPNPNFTWPLEWLEKLGNHAINKQTWFGHGHTIQCYSDFSPLSSSLKANHFFMVRPVLLEEELENINIGSKKITPLGIIPIFGEEMDFKQAKGTLKFLKRLIHKNVDEKLDDFRESTMKGRIRLFR